MGTAWGMFVSGLLFASGPCLASCGPLLVSYIAGTGKNPGEAFVFYSLFSLSRIAAYLALGLAVYFLGSMAGGYLFPNYVQLLGGIFISLSGLFIIAGKRLKYPFANALFGFFTAGRIRNPLVFGLVYGAIPCAPFLSLLSYGALISRSWPQALFYVLCFGIGTYLSPMLLLSLFSGTLCLFFKKGIQRYSRIIDILCGAVMIWLGILLLRKGL